MMQTTLNPEKSPARPFEPTAGQTQTPGNGTSGSAANLQNSAPTINATPAQAIRVILADSQAIYRVGMRKVFALEDDIRVVAQVENLQNLEAAIQRFPTDLVILEGGLITGTTDAIPAIVRRNPQVKIIIQAVSTDEQN